MTRTLAALSWPFTTQRLLLRLPISADVMEVWAWRRLPEVGEYLSSHPTHLQAFAADFMAQRDTLVVEHEGRVVGTAKLDLQQGWAQAETPEHIDRDQAELGWVLDPAVHGRGLGTELAAELLRIAFDELGLRRVEAHCFADNVASWRVMEKVRMRREGYFVGESLHRSGRFLDGMSYGLLADEWRARRP